MDLFGCWWQLNLYRPQLISKIHNVFTENETSYTLYNYATKYPEWHSARLCKNTWTFSSDIRRKQINHTLTERPWLVSNYTSQSRDSFC